VFIAPAGTRLFHGNSLSEDAQPEHLPYVKAGFAVVAYEIDGDLVEKPTDAQVFVAARMFKDAEAGLVNVRGAIDYVIAKVPAIDPQRLYTAGHSSAATLSLLVAENEPRIKACIAYAPVTDLQTWLPNELISALGRALPDYPFFLNKSSPITGVSRLRCPLFLFHADDDSVVPVEVSVNFAKLASQNNPSVKFVRATHGDHYDSMIDEGVPAAIQWLNKLP
jgi:dipeptidyl aminopeptidase/acylaminoacyl peptidase